MNKQNNLKLLSSNAKPYCLVIEGPKKHPRIPTPLSISPAIADAAVEGWIALIAAKRIFQNTCVHMLMPAFASRYIQVGSNVDNECFLCQRLDTCHVIAKITS